jgi:hypothetical protein
MRILTLHRYLLKGHPSAMHMTEAEALATDPRAVPMQGSRLVMPARDAHAVAAAQIGTVTGAAGHRDEDAGSERAKFG